MCAENQNHEKLALFYENDFFHLFMIYFCHLIL